MIHLTFVSGLFSDFSDYRERLGRLGMSFADKLRSTGDPLICG